VPSRSGPAPPILRAGGRRGRLSLAEHRLDLPKLRRLEPRRRLEPVAERGELERGHRLEDVDLGDQRLEDLQDPVEQMEGRIGVARLEHPLDFGELVEELLEPQLVHLMDDDEEQLVVLGPAVRTD
jgi:hypothetical protein